MLPFTFSCFRNQYQGARVLAFVTYWATVLLLFILAQLQRRCYLKWNEMTFTFWQKFWHCSKHRNYNDNSLWSVTFGQLSHSCSTCSTMWCHLKWNDFHFLLLFQTPSSSVFTSSPEISESQHHFPAKKWGHIIYHSKIHILAAKTFHIHHKKINVIECNKIKHVYSKNLSQMK